MPRHTTAIFGAVTPPPQSSPGLPVPAPPLSAPPLAPAPRAAVPAGPPVSLRPAAPPPPPEVEDFEDDPISVDIDEEPLPAPQQVAPQRPAPPRASLPVMPPRAPARPPAPAPAPALAVAAAGRVSEVHARPASLWRRLLSFAIDAAAIAGVASLYLVLASSVVGVEAAPKTGLTGTQALAAQARALESILVPGLVLVLVLALVYCAIAAFLWNGRTLGRRLLGLRLVDTHGLSPAPGRAIVRALLATLSFGLFLAGFWMALFDRRGQTLHDKLTSTFVVQPS